MLEAFGGCGVSLFAEGYNRRFFIGGFLGGWYWV